MYGAKYVKQTHLSVEIPHNARSGCKSLVSNFFNLCPNVMTYWNPVLYCSFCKFDLNCSLETGWKAYHLSHLAPDGKEKWPAFRVHSECVMANEKHIAAPSGSQAKVNHTILLVISGLLFSIWLGTVLFKERGSMAPGLWNGLTQKCTIHIEAGVQTLIM